MWKPGPPPSLRHLDEMTIAQTAETLTITDKAGHQRDLRPNGRKVRDEGAPQGPETLKAYWSKQGNLIVEVTPEKGPRRTETYQISNDRKHLFLTISVEGPEEVRVRRVYDPAP